MFLAMMVHLYLAKEALFFLMLLQYQVGTNGHIFHKIKREYEQEGFSMNQNINMHAPYYEHAYMNGHASYPQNIHLQQHGRAFNPYMNMNQGWNGMMNQNHAAQMYGNENNQPYYQQQQAYSGYEQNYFHPQNGYKPNHQNVFQNPLQQQEEAYQPMMQNMQQQYMNPYPKQSFIPKKQGNMKGLMNSFKTQDGTFDFNKMLDTAGMMMNAMNQVTGVVKGVGGIFKV